MTQWQAFNLVAGVVSGLCCIVSAIAIDRADRRHDCWSHGDVRRWRGLAVLSAASFGLNMLAFSVGVAS